LILCSVQRPSPISTVFPYTTLFRSGGCERAVIVEARAAEDDVEGVPLAHGAAGVHQRRVLAVDGAGHAVGVGGVVARLQHLHLVDRKSTRLNSSHVKISYAVFCSKK